VHETFLKTFLIHSARICKW